MFAIALIIKESVFYVESVTRKNLTERRQIRTSKFSKYGHAIGQYMKESDRAQTNANVGNT